ncbi:MAG: FdtA/QdtA family cupin domain-containing protein [Candidatus Micrarchaeota archaeon]|nr:FdtA/QdtA family cupin domain-containing protein [Candidatus Micrarchaeota archaeon]
MLTEKVKLLDFKINCSEEGFLIALENNKEIPFELKRVFYIYGTKKGVVRGKHANKFSRFVLIPVSGSCKVKTHDGNNEEIFILNTPTKGLYLNKMVWKEMYDFSPDCVLLVLTDQYYSSEEYIKSFDEFLKIVKKIDTQILK